MYYMYNSSTLPTAGPYAVMAGQIQVLDSYNRVIISHTSFPPRWLVYKALCRTTPNPYKRTLHTLFSLQWTGLRRFDAIELPEL